MDVQIIGFRLEWNFPAFTCPLLIEKSDEGVEDLFVSQATRTGLSEFHFVVVLYAVLESSNAASLLFVSRHLKLNIAGNVPQRYWWMQCNDGDHLGQEYLQCSELISTIKQTRFTSQC
jgi:hypothetical protein